MRTVLLLLCSNVFMTIAWYGHLKFKSAPLIVAIAVSWLIALPEYALQVPANRWGHNSSFTAPQLKIIQEVVSVGVFLVFSVVALGERPRWNEWVALSLVLAALVMAGYVGLIKPRPDEAAQAAPTEALSEPRVAEAADEM